VAAVLWALWVLGWRHERHPRPLDWAGIASYVVAVTGLLYALSAGAVTGWTRAPVVIAAGAFVVGLPVWILVESRHPWPLLHLPLMRLKPFGWGAVAASLNAVARMAVIFLMIFYFQGAQGESALEAGLRLIPLAAGMLVLAPVAGALADRWGTTWPATVGLAVSTLGFVGLALSLHAHTPYTMLAVWMAIIGIGAGVFNSPNTSRMMSAAGPARRGEASGIRALTTNTGMMLSVALAFAVVASTVPRGAMLAIFTGTASALPHAATIVPKFLSGVRLTFWAMAGLNVLAVAFSAAGGGSPRPWSAKSAQLALAVIVGLEARRLLNEESEWNPEREWILQAAIMLLEHALGVRLAQREGSTGSALDNEKRPSLRSGR
jgi:MFS family permease